MAAACQEGEMQSMGKNGCAPATRPDPRSPRLDDGNEVLCEECYQAALDEMSEELEAMR